MRPGCALRLLCASLSMAFPCAPAQAGDMTPPVDLPPAAAVASVLDASPMVRAAQAELRAAEAEHRVLRAGAHEYGLGLSGQRRSVSGGPDYAEWNLSLERGLRLPGKADLDDRIGRQGVLVATERIGDARHETARQLLTLWYAARQARAETALWTRQAELLQADMAVVQSRVELGDAAHLDLLQAEAALAQASSQSVAAQGREQAVLAELHARFPGLPEPEANDAGPAPLEGDEAHWLALTLAHNHELLAAQHALDQAQLAARRAEAERTPDPSLGMHLASEQGGNDKIIGLSVNIALPGAARRSRAQAMAAQAEALAEGVAATRRRLTAAAAANWQRAASGVASWQRLDAAAQAVARHADLARRAHELGERGLSETLLAQRSALEAELAAAQARLSANEAIARLMLDAHGLWPLGDQDRSGHPGE